MSERPPYSSQDSQKMSPKDVMLKMARHRFEEFAKVMEKTINSYFGSKEIKFTCKPGGWYIDLEKIEVNADPRFFIERGYSESEALFAMFHEAEHFRDMIQNPEVYQRFFNYSKTRTDVHPSYPKALRRLYNCIDDVLVNRVVMTRWHAGSGVKSTLYPKLFPSPNLRMAGDSPKEQPYHRQFMYALLREAMIPDEVCDVSPEVRAEIDEFQNRMAKKYGVKTLDFLTSVDSRKQLAQNDAEKRYDFMRIVLEPIFEKLYRLDLENMRNQEEGKEGGGPKRNKPRGGDVPTEKGDDPFEDDPFEDTVPDPVDPDELFDQVKKINDKIKENKDKKFEEVMGVSEKDLEAYRKDFRKIEKYIQALSEVFDRVISRRISYRKRLRQRSKEGLILDPSILATGYAEIKAGNEDPIMMLDYKRVEKINNMPSGLDFTIVCDGSGSISSDPARSRIERLLTVLAMEAFAEFRNRIEKERRKGERIRLDIRTGVHIFSNEDQEVIPLSEDFDHVARVRTHKALLNMPGGGNNEPATFDAIRQKQFDQLDRDRLAKGELKKIIIFLTDGESDQGAIQAKIKELYHLAGTTEQGNSNLVIAGIGFAEGKSAVDTYSPNGYYASSLEEINEIFVKIIENVLEDV